LLETVCPENRFINFLESIGGQFNGNDDKADVALKWTIIVSAFFLLSATKTS
jgi:hypothetical protein